MYRFKVAQFIVICVNRNSKKQAGVSSVDQFVIVVFDKIGVFLVACGHQPVYFRFNADFFQFRVHRTAQSGCRRRDIPFTQTGLPLAILQQDKPNLNGDQKERRLNCVSLAPPWTKTRASTHSGLCPSKQHTTADDHVCSARPANDNFKLASFVTYHYSE